MKYPNTQHATRNTQSSIKPKFSFQSLILLILTTATLLFAGISFADDKVFESGVLIEGWERSYEDELPVLQFNIIPETDPTFSDIKPENIVQQENGAIRYQLSHSTPFGRQDFAHVISVNNGEGMIKHTITMIADGQQSSFLSRDNNIPSLKQPLLASLGSQSLQTTGKNDQPPEGLGIFVAAAVACTVAVASFIAACNLTCNDRGGVDDLNVGVCGVAFSSCNCRDPIME